MVYGGKPSRGCRTCKTRKIKCDEGRPTCAQCKKSSKVCLGYPDEADLIFRDQSSIFSKRTRRNKRTEAIPSPSSTCSVTKSQSHNGALQVLPKKIRGPSPSNLDFSTMTSFFDAMVSIQPPPTLPIEEQVVQVYFKNFSILYRNDESVRGFLPYLVPMYSESRQDSPLRVATRATALCAISQLPAQRQLRHHATRMYSKAIMAVAKALQDPVEARSDETLQATLLLCLYESIRASDGTIKAWSNHVDGATAIILARGQEQFNNVQSVSLFRAARTQMLTNCIRREIPPPPFPGEEGWMPEASLEGEHAELADLTPCAIALPEFLFEAKGLLKLERRPDTMVIMSDFIERAYNLTTMLTGLNFMLPNHWLPRTVAYINKEPEDLASAEAWLGPVHEYTDIHIASAMNKFRSVCMFSTWIILDCVAWLSPDMYELDGRWQHAKFVEQSVIDEICSSVPFLFNWRSEAKTKSVEQMETIADMIGGLSLVWPLGGAVFSPRLSAQQKTWIWGRLRKISEEGLEQASLLETDVKNTLDSFLNRRLY